MSGWNRSWMSAMACWPAIQALQPTSFRWLPSFLDGLLQDVQSQHSCILCPAKPVDSAHVPSVVHFLL